MSGWQAPEHDYGPGHRGVDTAAVLGEDVMAPDAGTVLFAGSVAGRSLVTIDHGGGLVSTLDAIVPAVGAGDPVERGGIVGVVAPGTVAPGHCPSATTAGAGATCLHIGARLDGLYVDPMGYLGRPAWPVLLPLE